MNKEKTDNNRAEIGDWLKAAGGMYGVVKTARGWKTFGCVICARNMGLLTGKRLQNDPTRYKIAIEKMERGGIDIQCCGVQAHRTS